MWTDAEGYYDRNCKWVEVGIFKGPVFADMAKDLLRQNDIPCLVNKTFIGSAYGLHSTNTPGMAVKIMAPEIVLKESREILFALSDEWDEEA